mmetsp:Transcript_19285/g.41458  ORF Transcript_19285/g.41458 Transcript_19285/m.41458 type:complete len:490 (+) Transcript_19285:146-1615(+)|eukprot:CAMPEP_0168743622 /NCGR_PEP_ID=MMETSP0724-20121128/13671_1 /TAXON_ID=265536 /ORGANISM="Amphiprora sp., Strain CCMP467" /LENGTH=489 /DNA_ID=CAMNT_0008791257 /DNA_START=57 /DNA_END=1526 /DNA_ORIENTATION=-
MFRPQQDIISSDLTEAAADGELQTVKAILQKHPDWVDVKNSNGFTALLVSSEEGRLEVVQYLVVECHAKVNLQETNYCGWTPLHKASRRGHLDVIQCLVEQGRADMNIANDQGMTALHDASMAGHFQVVEFLVEQGANINAQEKDGWTPLHRACSDGHLEIIRFLVRRGATVEVRDKTHAATPLMYATTRGYPDIVEFLVNDGHANVNIQDDRGDSPLHWACHHGHWRIVQFLVGTSGADVTLKNNKDLTPLDVAQQKFRSQIVEYLQKHMKSQVEKEQEAEVAIDTSEALDVYLIYTGTLLGIQDVLYSEGTRYRYNVEKEKGYNVADLEQCRHFVAVITKEFLESPIACMELQYAFRRMQWLHAHGQWHSLWVILYDGVTLEDYTDVWRNTGKKLPPLHRELQTLQYNDKGDDDASSYTYFCRELKHQLEEVDSNEEGNDKWLSLLKKNFPPTDFPRCNQGMHTVAREETGCAPSGYFAARDAATKA